MSDAMNRVCACGREFIFRPSRKQHKCNHCVSAKRRETKQKQKENGTYERIAARNREYDAAYRISYNQKPEVKERRRSSSRRQIERHPEKYLARQVLQHALRKREITKGTCQVCGNPQVDGHHEDYTKPLDVMWLCRRHHTDVHQAQARARKGGG